MAARINLPNQPRVLFHLVLLSSLLLAACAPIGTPPSAAPSTPATPLVAAFSSATSALATATTPARPTTAVPTPAAAPIAFDTQHDLESLIGAIAGAPPAEAQARADAFWQALVSCQREPLVYGDEVFYSALEAHTWSQWRGLSDEMLAFFFATK